MHTITKYAVLLLLCASCSSALAEAEPLRDCEVVARVNGEVILACELLWEVELIVQERLAGLPPEQVANVPPEVLEELREQVMQGLLMSRLDMTLFYADFRASVPQADLAAIHKNLNKQFEVQEVLQLAKRLEAEDRADIEKKLYELGTTLDERREEFYKKMIARSWLTETVEFDREVTHEDMLAYYLEHESDYANPERARWEELMVQHSRFPNKRSAYAAIAQLGNKAHKSTSALPAATPAFGVLAKTSSHGFTASKGGLHGWTTRGSLSTAAIDQAIFSLHVGEMSPILESPLGFHIVRVLERQPAGKTPFRDVQNDIRKSIRDERFNTAINARVTEMKSKARIWTVFTGDIDMTRVAERNAGDTK